MPYGQARYWDSLESGEFLDERQSQTKEVEDDICEEEELTIQILHKENLEVCHQQWISELSLATEHECQSILYAKSLLVDADSVPSTSDIEHKFSTTSDQFQRKRLDYVIPEKSHKISIRLRSQSESTSIPSIPPPKPQRRLARLRNNKNEIIGPSTDKTPVTYSTLDLIESCKFNESTYASIDGWRHANQAQSTLALNTQERSQVPPWTPPGLRSRRVGVSIPQLNSSFSLSTSNISRKPQLPAYEQLTIRVEKDGNSKVIGRRPTVVRHTVAVNSDDVEKARKLCNTSQQTSIDSNRVSSIAAPSSPKSMNSDSTLSVDSGQCSGDLALTSFSSSREEKESNMDQSIASTYQSYQQRCLPSYARMASTMDHVLRTSSTIYSLLSTPNEPNNLKELASKASVFIQILESSPCAQHLPKVDINSVKTQIAEQQQSPCEDPDASLGVSNYFSIVVRKLVEQVLQLFIKIICKYIGECGNKDRLLIIALEHLVHIVLFGDELCLETIQSGGISNLMKLIRSNGTPSDTVRLLLRAMAVLCGVAKGCLALLSLGGLDVVLQHLSSTSTPCAIEAAGVLTQLTNPQHSFVRLNHVSSILSKLLDLIDVCTTGESLLLVSAALANVTLQDPLAVDMLYKHNSITRLIQAYNRQHCSTIFVQEQLVTTFSRLAARRYEEALIAQGAIPVLLEMLTVMDTVHVEYCRRIRYKAAVCIGTLAATGIGLKALYNHQAYAILCHVLEMESSTANPLNMICTNIRNKLESKYRIESVV